MGLETLSNSSKSRSKPTALERVHLRSHSPVPHSPAHNLKHQSCVCVGESVSVYDYLWPSIRESLQGAIILLLSVSAS